MVLDVTNGHVLAMASYPSYDPTVWVGGISSKEYTALTAKKANTPLLSRAIQGQFVPASTFKIVSAAAALQNGYTASETYQCPGVLQVGNRKFSNFEGESPGPVDLAKGLAVSCDTMWYGIADAFWRKDGGLEPVAKPKDPFEKMAKSFGYGKRTGIDLPSESRGRVGGRAFKTALNEQLHDAWCQRAVTGYPEVAKTDQKRATYLKALAKENCADGGVFRVGDAVNLVHRPGRHGRHPAAGGPGLRRGRQRRHDLPAAGRQGHRRQRRQGRLAHQAEGDRQAARDARRTSRSCATRSPR